MKSNLLTLLFFMALCNAKSQPISLVNEFGGRGFVHTNIEKTNGVGGGSIIKILPLANDNVLAITQNNAVTNIIKLLPSGAIDNSFGINGIATGNNFNATCAALQADGKIIIGGTTSAQDGMSALARFNSNGTVDSSFAQIGRTSFKMGTIGSSVSDICLQSNGNIIICGTVRTSTTTSVIKFGVARLLPTGILDNSFDGDGFAIIAVTSSTTEAPSCVAVQTDGSIAVAGYSYPAIGVRSLSIAKLTNTGALDTGFDTDGILLDNFSNNAYANDIAIQSDDKILVGGSRYWGSEFVSYLIRYNTNGTKDASFDTDGVLDMPFPTPGSFGGSYLKEMFIANNSIYAMHDVGNLPGNNGFAITKNTMSGTFDNSFNGNGIVQTNFDPGNFDEGICIGISAEGKIYAGGQVQNPYSLTFLGINKFNADGTADNTFDAEGKLLLNINSSEDIVNDIVRQPDGKVIAVGTTRKTLASPSTQYTTQNGLAMARYKSDGTLDSTFGTNGLVVEYTVTNSVLANSVILQPDGKIVITGQSKAGGMGIARYNANGTIDNTFGTGGRTNINTIPIFTATDQMGGGNDMYLLPTGKILVVGQAGTVTLNQSHSNLVVVRFNADGTKDNTFGTSGQATGTGSTYSNEVGYALAVQTDGKIVAVGNSDNNFFAIRFSDTGTPDPTFNGTSKQSVSFGNNTATARSVYIQGDGKIILAGNTVGDALLYQSDFTMLRFLNNGTLDASFGTNGLVQTNLGFDSEAIKAISLQGDGSIIVAATGRSNIDSYNFMLAKYSSAGVLSTTFNNGLVNKDFLNGSFEQLNCAYMNGGIIYAGGFAETSTGKDFLLAAYDFSLNPVPLHFLSFSVQKCNANQACLTWKTANEQNVSHFEIERSVDGVSFVSVGTKLANNLSLNTYTSTDNMSALTGNKVYYRITQIDYDGQSKRSSIVVLNKANKGIDLYPTFVKSGFTIQNNADTKMQMQLADGLGRMVLNRQLGKGSNWILIENLSAGTYYYTVTNVVTQEKYTGKIIKQ